MEILDLLDELEHLILEAKKGMLSGDNQVLVNKKKSLELIDAVRKVINDKYQLLKMSIDAKDGYKEAALKAFNNPDTVRKFQNEESKNIIIDAHKQANEIKKEIDDYADAVLENLKVTVAKFKRKLVKLDSVIDLSKERIENTAHYTVVNEGEHLYEK